MDRVGIVLISHSAKVAEGLKDMIEQMIQDVPVEAAGGTEDGELGTSLEKINAAIEQVYSKKGVILFYDIGSAKMNAEMAIEFSGKDNIYIVDAPLVESAYVAAVESSTGCDIEIILKNINNNY